MERRKRRVRDVGETWVGRCRRSVARERAAAEARYNVLIGQTALSCSKCGEYVTGPMNHECKKRSHVLGASERSTGGKKRGRREEKGDEELLGLSSLQDDQ